MRDVYREGKCIISSHLQRFIPPHALFRPVSATNLAMPTERATGVAETRFEDGVKPVTRSCAIRTRAIARCIITLVRKTSTPIHLRSRVVTWERAIRPRVINLGIAEFPTREKVAGTSR